MALQTVYCSKNIFEKVVDYETDTTNQLKKIYNILFQYSDILLDISESEFDKKIEDGDVFYRAFNKRGIVFSPLPHFFRDMEDENLSGFSTDIFLVDKTKEFTSKNRFQNGILIANLEEILEGKLIDEIDTPAEYIFTVGKDHAYRNWGSLFNDRNLKPLNSLVIIDNFLLDEENYLDTIYNNLCPIVTFIIPKDLDIPFHLTLVFKNVGRFRISKETAETIALEIEKEIQSASGKTIEVGLVAHIDKDFHKRCILTNHFFMYSDKGFNIFNDRSKIVKNTDGDIRWVYDSILKLKGDIRKQLHSEFLARTKEIIKSNSNPLKSSYIEFNVGLEKNRLLF